MCVVLLLSLGAFGFLVNQSQEAIMEEVARTASEVGKATLRTLDFTPADPAHLLADDTMMVWHTAGELETAGEIEDVTHRVRRELRAATVDIKGPLPTGEMITSNRTVTVRRLGAAEPQVAIVECTEIPEAGSSCTTTEGEQAAERYAQIVLAVEEVRTEADPSSGGMVLRIPFAKDELPEEVRDGHFGAHMIGKTEWEFESADHAHEAAMTAAEQLHSIRDEFRLPIPVEKYQAQFDRLRRRSLFLALGVFLVGTALSAGLANRFTRPVRRLDAGIRQLSGGDLDVEVPVHGRDEVARLGAAFNEMTRKLRASRDRSREMVRREKLSALGRLAAGVAHEVRNPLHSINLTLQHLVETCRPDDGERAEEFDSAMEILRGEIRRLDRTVSNFLRFAKSEDNERCKIDLRLLVDEVVQLIGKEAEWRKVEIHLDAPDEMAELSVDSEAIRSSLLNLFLNSFEAMPEGGRLEVVLRDEGDHALLEVKDDGHGIPEELQEKVFDFAYTTRDGGSGVGLALVHQCVVEEHGGRVHLDSSPGTGTTVRIELPRAAETGEQA
jgi:signal transduction histidine kinase